ncbi:hypothetical protein P9969_005065 [Citrobacter amalonaticus]|nr:hypothetical protein [Citrobacter amalonaticus]MEC5722885.1 hypothetical protein [Citrobacter amalonaticus]
MCYFKWRQEVNHLVRRDSTGKALALTVYAFRKTKTQCNIALWFSLDGAARNARQLSCRKRLLPGYPGCSPPRKNTLRRLNANVQ